MKTRFIFLTITLQLLFAFVIAQNSPGLKTFVPASPNTASLGKYGEIPVSLYTGIPDIHIPLYNLKSRDLELPISLSYHAGGVRVEEIASWVGIGWSLNAGGVITRSIRGMPDDAIGGYFGGYYNMTQYAKKYLTNLSPASNYSFGAGNAAASDMEYLKVAQSQIQDAEPDIFYFNFGKYSGKFFMNENGQFVSSPLEALKITYDLGSANSGRLTRWTIVTPDGVKYVFGNSIDGTNTAIENNENAAPYGFATTGWYLVEIYSPNNDLITLNYTNVTYNYQNRASEVLNQVVAQSLGGAGIVVPKDNLIVTNYMTSPRLATIRSANGTITFSPGPDRSDLPGEASLASFSIFSKNDLVNPIKLWVFNYDYFTTRLTLEGLTEQSQSGLNAGNYKFQYAGQLPDNNPNGTSINSQDLWGYYNGAYNTFLPQGAVLTTAGSQTISIAGADRHSDGNFMQAGTLTKITYPTGGYSMFDYEANTVYASSTDNTIPNAGVGEVAGFHYLYNETKTQTFSVVYPDPNSHIVTVSAISRAMNNTCPFDNVGYSQCYYASIVGVNGTQYGPLYFKEGTTTFNLPPGTYMIEAQGTSLMGQQDNNFYLYFDWTEFPPPSTTSTMINKQIGGLRIQRITNNDGNNNTTIKKYLYNTLSDNAVSSGVLVNQPYNYVNVYREYLATVSGASMPYSDVLQVRSYPLIPLMPTQGAPIGYQNVTELSGENGENGKTEYTFTTANDFPDELKLYRPYPPACSYDWRRGLQLKSTTYKNVAGNFISVQSKSNQYINAINQSTAYGFTIDTDVKIVGDAANADLVAYTEYYVAGYKTVSEFYYLQSDTLQVYDQNNPSSYIQTINNYTYDITQGHFQLEQILTTNSKNQIVETDIRYPQDLTLSGSAETARQSLISQFILTPFLDKKTLVNGAPTTETRNNYNVFPNGLTLPGSIELQIGSNPSEKRIEFLQYDNYGNLLKQHKINDVLNTYIWDYNSAYPIASISNGDNSDVAYTSFEADGTGNWTIPVASMDPINAITGTSSYNLSSGPITKTGLTIGKIYLVTYWSKNGSYFIAGGVVSTRTGRNVNGWLYIEQTVTMASTTLTITGTGNIDELRLFPQGAMMTTYTYSPLVGMTSMGDPNSEITYYEYDGLNRLKNVKDYQGNIVKNYQYNYANSCGSNCYVLPMQTFNGSNTIGYPVGVFNLNGVLLGNASTQAQYISLWNGSTADQQVGTLLAAVDPLHFNFTVATGQHVPSAVTGCRYYQFDLHYTTMDAVRSSNGVYIDFGDGTGFRIDGAPTAGLPASTTVNFFRPGGVGYYVHTYPDSTTKTISFYHNDATEQPVFDNFSNPAASLTLVSNLRGNFPQYMQSIGSSSFQQSTALSVASISNWASISSLQTFGAFCGDGGISPSLHMSYPQDFMAANKGLKSIWTTYGFYDIGYADPSFKLSRLKSDWNTFFTNLQYMQISDAHWAQENLSALTQLNSFTIWAAPANGGNVSGSNPVVAISSTAINNIIIQIAAGAGQYVSNGFLNIASGGTGRTTDSDGAFNLLKSKGWTIYVNGVQL